MDPARPSGGRGRGKAAEAVARIAAPLDFWDRRHAGHVAALLHAVERGDAGTSRSFITGIVAGAG